IGWDDTYSALNFKNPPAGDGAFLIKNSHGDTANNGDGLFHLSYYDLYAGFNAYAIPEVMYDGNFNIYEYDKMGMNASFGYSQAASIEYACVFEKKNSDPEYITAISFYATNPNSKYEILINAAMPASQEKPSFKDMTSILEKSIEYSGYYTVELPVPIKISDSKFVIAIQPTTLNGTNARAAVETTSKSINFVPSLNSYIRLGNSPQEYQQLPNADVCIKAITKSTNSPITAVNSLRDGKFHTVLKNNTGVALDGKLCIGTYENMILTDITFADIHSNSYDTSADFSILAPAENGKTYKSIYLKDLPSIQPLTQP
ncbi:MAG: lectin like domain-containing protein, partial [Oscillospiraceae bacterium]